MVGSFHNPHPPTNSLLAAFAAFGELGELALSVLWPPELASLDGVRCSQLEASLALLCERLAALRVAVVLDCTTLPGRREHLAERLATMRADLVRRYGDIVQSVTLREDRVPGLVSEAWGWQWLHVIPHHHPHP